MRVYQDRNPPSMATASFRDGETTKPRRTLRIALVFPPAMLPTSPPLGIAVLKSYLHSSENIEVRNFDLNLAYFEQAFNWLEDGRLRMRIQKMDFETTAQRAAAARNFFLGGEGIDRFSNLSLYNEHAGVYASFGSVLNGLFDNFARKVLLGLPAPLLADRFFNGLIAPLKAFEPDLIGFSILFSQQLFFALALTKLFKCGEQPNPNCELARSPRAIGTRIVLGGATFSVMPNAGRLLAGSVTVSLGREQREVDAAGLIDYIIVGEGERGLESLAKSIATDCAQDVSETASYPLCHVPGLLHSKDGRLVEVPSEAVLDLNALPLPDFSDFPLEKYHSPIPVLPYLSSRGCPWRRCAFCTHQKTYLAYREEDAAATAGRLSALRGKYGVSHSCLVDEMVHPRRMDRIASVLIRKGVRVYISAYAKPSGFSSKLLEKAHKAGFRLLMWGLESASQRMLDLMCKGTNVKQIEAIFDSACKAGIWNLLFVISGFPTETMAEWQKTLDFLNSNQKSIHALSRSRFILLEGSDIFLNPWRYGIKRVIDRPKRDPVSIAYDYEVTEGLTQEEVAAMYRKSLDRLSGIGRSAWFGQFREHMLLFASEAGND